MKKLQFRIISILMTVFVIFSICIGFFSTQLLQDYAVESQEEALVEQAIMAGSSLDGVAKDPSDFLNLKQRHLF